MRRWLPVVLAVGIVVCGCVPSANMERSLLRGAGDTSITAVADGTGDSNVSARLAGAKAVATALAAFMDSGNVSSMTVSALRTELVQRVPQAYTVLVDRALAMVSTKHVDVGGAVGVRNVKRIKAYLVGVVRGADKYKVGDR